MSTSNTTPPGASAPEVPLLRLQQLTRLPAWAFGLLCGSIMFCLLISPVVLVRLAPPGNLEILGNALFFASSIAILAGGTESVLAGAARDLEKLRGVIRFSDSEFESLRGNLGRQSNRSTLVLLVLGFLLGLGHNYVLGQHRNPMPFLVTQTTATLLMWVFMMLTLPKMIRNASLFSRLGRQAQPDLLRPSRHAAFGAAALRPAFFLIGIICVYAFLLLGDDNPFDDGVWIGLAASFVTLVGIVVLPLRGIRQRIRETRQASLAALDARIESLDITDLGSASVSTLEEMDTVLDMRERVARAPGWPLDLAGLKRILLYIVLPPMTWAAAAIVEMLIDQAV